MVIRLDSALLILALAVVSAAGCRHESTCLTKGTRVATSGTHMHTATVPREDVKAGGGGPYAVLGGDHEHALTLRQSDFELLQEGQPVRTVTSSVNAQTHEFLVECIP